MNFTRGLIFPFIQANFLDSEASIYINVVIDKSCEGLGFEPLHLIVDIGKWRSDIVSPKKKKKTEEGGKDKP